MPQMRSSVPMLAGFLGALLGLTPAQSLPSRPGEAPEILDDALLLEKMTKGCAELAAKGVLLDLGKVRGDVPPSSCSLTLPQKRKGNLDGPGLRELAAKSTLVVGTYHLCDHCSEWHFVGASGVAIAEGGIVATCWHVLLDDPSLKNPKLAVADLRGRVWPVFKVLAADPDSDVCILQTGAAAIPALSLELDVRPGARVACLSNPDDHYAFYSEGSVARWCVVRDAPVTTPAESRPSGVPMLEVTLDFAKGSSGAPILDFQGNVVALAQATQTVLFADANDPTGLQMVFKIAAPARALAKLAR